MIDVVGPRQTRVQAVFTIYVNGLRNCELSNFFGSRQTVDALDERIC